MAANKLDSVFRPGPFDGKVVLVNNAGGQLVAPLAGIENLTFTMSME